MNEKYKEFYEQGKLTEKEFIKKNSEKGINYSESTALEDINQHFDVISDEGKKSDVKGQKKINRSDDTVSSDINWIELKNVKGENGWVISEADTISFDMGGGDFLEVERDKLICMIYDRVIKKARINYFSDDYLKMHGKVLYKFHNRDKRPDCVVMVKNKDLFYAKENQEIDKEKIEKVISFSKYYVSNKQVRKLNDVYKEGFNAKVSCFVCGMEEDYRLRFDDSQSGWTDEGNYIHGHVYCNRCGSYYERKEFKSVKDVKSVIRWLDRGFDDKYKI